MPPRDDQLPEIVGGSDRPLRLVGRADGVSVPIDRRALRDVVGDADPTQIVLDIENIDAERNPGTVYGVYVNLPENPSPTDLAAHHAGNISLFGIERTREPRADAQAHGGMRVAIDITGLAAFLRDRGSWSDEDVRVTFRPIGLEVAAGADDDEAAVVRDDVEQSQQHEDVPITVGRVSVQMR